MSFVNVKQSTAAPVSDTTLVELCRTGDEAAWRMLIERYGSLILSIPRRYGLSSALVDDVFSEVCMALVRALRTIRDPEKLASWISRTTTRTTWAQARQARAAVRQPLEPPSGPAAPVDVATRVEEEQLVRSALAKVPSRCRRLLELLYFAAPTPSYDAVARKLRVPRGSLGPTRRRCLDRMRLHLEPLLGETHRNQEFPIDA